MIEPTRCPRCGAILPLDAPRCPACYGEANLQNPVRTPVPAPPNADSNQATFGLGSLMLVMTLIGIVLGLFVIEPGIGIAALLLMTPALVRTVIRIKKGQRLGESLDLSQKAVAFLGSLGVMIATVLSVVIAFVGTCWGLFFVVPSPGYVGFAFALLCAFFMIRWLWPIRLHGSPHDSSE